MAVWRIVGDHAEPVEGVVLTGVHSADRCEGRPCVIHAPSEHRMASWPLHWRDDRRLFERTCPHGVGHPDPDHMAWLRSILVDPEDAVAEGIHGCDGCCAADSPHDASEPPPSATDPQKTPEGAGGAVESDQSPSGRLRRAADLIEQTAEDLYPAWSYGTYEDSAGGTRGFVGGALGTDGQFVADVPSAINAHWIALVGPQVVAPLAAWLRATADAVQYWPPFLAEWKGGGDGEYHAGQAAKAALALADVILGSGR